MTTRPSNDAAKPTLEVMESKVSKTCQSGWVMIPKTITPAMEAVYANDAGAYQTAQALHDAMLAAAPTPPKAEAVAYCAPDDPHNATAFAWPGTMRIPHIHTMPLYTAQPAPTPDLIRDAALCSGYAGGMLVSDNEKHVIHLHYESRKQVEAAYECLTGRIDAAIREQQRREGR